MRLFLTLLFSLPVSSFAIDHREGLHCVVQQEIVSLCPQVDGKHREIQFWKGQGSIEAKSCEEKNHVLTCDFGESVLRYDLFDFYIT